MILTALFSFLFIQNAFAAPAPSEADLDKDGIVNTEDVCPNIPAPKTSDGCPVFKTRKSSSNNNVAKVSLYPDSSYYFYEKTEMKKGDIFKAVTMNTKTKVIFTESNALQVKD